MPAPVFSRRFRVGTMVGVAVLGLIALGLGLDAYLLVRDLFAQNVVLGAVGAALAALVAGGLGWMVMRELHALGRLQRIDETRALADRALAENDMKAARLVVGEFDRLYHRRPELAWARSRFRDHDHGAHDPRELLTLLEQQVLLPLDARANAAIGRAARLTAVFTAVVPFAFVDSLAVLWRNLRLVREIAACYGGRPGLIGSATLLRRVMLYMVFAGGIEAGDGVATHVLGGGMAGWLSARLGQGVLNGLMTARIGLATVQLCRPLPYLRAAKPSIRDMAAAIAQDVKRQV